MIGINPVGRTIGQGSDTIDPSLAPDPDDVRYGVSYFDGMFVGNLMLTEPENIKIGVGIGTEGTEITGTYVGPATGIGIKVSKPSSINIKARNG